MHPSRLVLGHTPRIIVTDSQIFVGGDKILCLAYPSGEVVWEQQDVYLLRGATFLLAGGKLYAGTFGEVTCYSAADGKCLWTFPGKGHDPVREEERAAVALGTPFNTMQMDDNT